MEVNRQTVNSEYFTIILENNYVTGDSELKMFSDIITKIYKESRRVGYKKLFTKEEREFIDELSEYFVAPEPKPNGVEELTKAQYPNIEEDED